jgi:hypothetical protein
MSDLRQSVARGYGAREYLPDPTTAIEQIRVEMARLSAEVVSLRERIDRCRCGEGDSGA